MKQITDFYRRRWRAHVYRMDENSFPKYISFERNVSAALEGSLQNVNRCNVTLRRRKSSEVREEEEKE